MVLVNLFWVSLLGQGVGPDGFQMSLPTSTFCDSLMVSEGIGSDLCGVEHDPHPGPGIRVCQHSGTWQ